MMKSYLLILVILFVSCQSSEKKREKTDAQTTSVQIQNRSYSFGEIKSTDSAQYSYKIKNVGKIPLLIKKVETTCGCTIPEWSNKPILVNEEGIIRVKFKPKKGFMGIIKKTISFQANTDSIFHFLYISGEVIK